MLKPQDVKHVEDSIASLAAPAHNRGYDVRNERARKPNRNKHKKLRRELGASERMHHRARQREREHDFRYNLARALSERVRSPSTITSNDYRHERRNFYKNAFHDAASSMQERNSCLMQPKRRRPKPAPDFML